MTPDAPQYTRIAGTRAVTGLRAGALVHQIYQPRPDHANNQLAPQATRCNTARTENKRWDTNMKTAHYFKTYGGAFVIISADLSTKGEWQPVSGKREARVLAKKAGAVCWNF